VISIKVVKQCLGQVVWVVSTHIVNRC
jgi:hypothetical protein